MLTLHNKTAKCLLQSQLDIPLSFDRDVKAETHHRHGILSYAHCKKHKLHTYGELGMARKSAPKSLCLRAAGAVLCLMEGCSLAAVTGTACTGLGS